VRAVCKREKLYVSFRIITKIKNDLSHSYDIHLKSCFHCCVLRDEINKTRSHLHIFFLKKLN
jgi:hypothetical protein